MHGFKVFRNDVDVPPVNIWRTRLQNVPRHFYETDERPRRSLTPRLYDVLGRDPA